MVATSADMEKNPYKAMNTKFRGRAITINRLISL